jgi:uroporphyrinogen decarboxylase
VDNPYGAYEEFASWPLSQATSVAELHSHPWPEPDWWDFKPIPGLLRLMDEYDEYHIRFRIGSIFELSWQLRGMQEFLVDLALDPGIPVYIMDRFTELYLENLRRVLEIAGDRLDMIYFYDDVATQNSLMISKEMWHEYIRPRHAKLVDLAHAYGKPVMYHCDGAIHHLIPELIDLGIDVLNPIQPDAKGMDLKRIKEEYGDKLTFHGGVDIIKTMPRGTPAEVIAEVSERVNVLGKNGGYILCSSHHLQPDTPVENILAMYDLRQRYRREPSK